jgi:hypothetical protein
MARGGHNWKGGGVVEGTTSLDVMQLARADYLSGPRQGSWKWNDLGGMTASIQIKGSHELVTLEYRVRDASGDWHAVRQDVPIRWSPCRFGGERPWFLCDVFADGTYCGRRVAKLYGAGRLFACRHCYCLGYAIQRDRQMDQAHHNLARMHRKLGADYDGPDGPTPPKPKWMRWKTYSRIAKQIEAGQMRLDEAFVLASQRIIAWEAKLERRGTRR